MATSFLIAGPQDARLTLLLAHGAGAPMDSTSMTAATEALVRAGFRVARFEFAYMSARRRDEGRKPPPKAEKLIPEFIDAIGDLGMTDGSLFIGGKSMGGRVASMVADALHGAGRIAGLVCLGYPFHPPEKPEQLRTAHLRELKTPTLIVQGTRDPLGTRIEVSAYALSAVIEVLWLEDGDHDLKPRKSVSGFTAAQHLETMGRTTADWAATVLAGRAQTAL